MSIKFDTYNDCLDAVKQCGTNLENVLCKWKTYELCEAAVSDTGLALRYVPEDIQTLRIILLAMNNCKDAFQFVAPKFQKDRVLCTIAMKQTLDNAIYIPDENEDIVQCIMFIRGVENPSGNILSNILKRDLGYEEYLLLCRDVYHDFKQVLAQVF
jgi:hypothetical protein